jgi:YHS domain-containing protein
MTDKTKDPVCGMDVDQAEVSTEYKGETYSFCCEACKEEFEKAPEKYLKDQDKGGCCS